MGAKAASVVVCGFRLLELAAKIVLALSETVLLVFGDSADRAPLEGVDRSTCDQVLCSVDLGSLLDGVQGDVGLGVRHYSLIVAGQVFL